MNTNHREIKIRNAVAADSEKLWVLMKELAVFENYIDSFAITPAIVLESGFKKIRLIFMLSLPNMAIQS